MAFNFIKGFVLCQEILSKNRKTMRFFLLFHSLLQKNLLLIKEKPPKGEHLRQFFIDYKEF